ncbi:hypothetical protein JXL21_11470 [Candidatus Bathyarchaeota archaeon]|nr:hypothetical protein [Candidatus Bathyarchaeota archaeon]
MPFVRRYKDLSTNLDGLYTDVVKELQQEKDLEIVKETNGVINDVSFRSVTAARATVPRAVTGTLREVTVTLAGDPDDWMLELHTGAWFGNMVLPGAGGFLIAGPVGSAAAAGTSTLMAVTYGRKLKNQIKNLVKKHSGKKYTEAKVETFIS